MPYDWIIKSRADVDKKLKDRRKGYHEPPRPLCRKGFVDGPCPYCGFEPLGLRKTCPACVRWVAA